MGRTPTDRVIEGLSDPAYARLYGDALLRCELGIRLSLWRAAHGLSDSVMADRLGISLKRYHDIAMGEANPRIGEVGQWFATLGLSLKFEPIPLEPLLKYR